MASWRLYILRIFVVPQQSLSMLPAVDATDVAHATLHNCLKRLALAIAPVCAFHVRWLDFPSVVDDFTMLVDEGLDGCES